jgi:O-antigen ligase
LRKTSNSVRYRTDAAAARALYYGDSSRTETDMYFGGGILGTILIIALIIFLVRRS